MGAGRLGRGGAKRNGANKRDAGLQARRHEDLIRGTAYPLEKVDVVLATDPETFSDYCTKFRERWIAGR